MRNLMLSFFAICLFSCPLFYASCDQDEVKLPPITTEGKNTLGCLVDGKIWLPRVAFFNRGGIYTSLQTAVDTLGINIDAENATTDGITISFFDSPTLQTGRNYDLTNPKFYVEYRNLTGNRTCFYDSVLSGFVNVLRFDTKSQIVSGTFEFKVYDADCNATVTISDGRFDLMYNR